MTPSAPGAFRNRRADHVGDFQARRRLIVRLGVLLFARVAPLEVGNSRFHGGRVLGHWARTLRVSQSLPEQLQLLAWWSKPGLSIWVSHNSDLTPRLRILPIQRQADSCCTSSVDSRFDTRSYQEPFRS